MRPDSLWLAEAWRFGISARSVLQDPLPRWDRDEASDQTAGLAHLILVGLLSGQPPQGGHRLGDPVLRRHLGDGAASNSRWHGKGLR